MNFAIGIDARGQRHVALAGFRKFEVGMKNSATHGDIRTTQLDIGVTYRREYLAAALRAGEEYVQSPLAALRRHWPKALRHITIGIACVANRNEDHVAFVTLNILKVLYK